MGGAGDVSSCLMVVWAGDPKSHSEAACERGNANGSGELEVSGH